MRRSIIFKFVLLSVMLMGSYMQATADSFTTLSITQNGEKTYYQLSDIRKMTFDAENMYLSLTSNEVVTLPFSSLTTVSFGDVTGIATLKGADEGLALKDGQLCVNMQNEGKVLIYDPSGKVIEQIAVTKGQNTISLSHLSKGVYIIRVNGITSKVMNK